MQSDCDKPYTPRKLNFYFINAEAVDHFTMWWLTKWARERADTFLFGSVVAPKATAKVLPSLLLCGHSVPSIYRGCRMMGLL